MKSKLFKLLTLLLALCMILCACGISSDKDDDDDKKSDNKVSNNGTVELTDEEMIVGDWVATIDCGEFFAPMMAESMGEELAAYFDFDGIGFDFVLSFGEDGEYSMALDEASLEVFADDVMDVMMTGLRAYMEDALGDLLGEQTLDEYLEDNGMSFDELMASSGLDAETLTSSMVESFDSTESTGEYSLEDGKLILDSDVHEYELDGERMTIQAPEGEDDEMVELLFPMELEKVN